MALVSPGVSVSVTDQSFFFPQSSPTLPLFFIATRAGKLQSNGITPAAGTLESNVVRTVTSVRQSLELYGVPYFHSDVSGNEFHGDSRNEYGLLALNQALGVLGRAFVVRADVDLNDAPVTFISLGVPAQLSSSLSYNGVGNGALSSVTVPNNTVKPEIISIVMTSSTNFTVSGSKSGYIGSGVVGTVFTSDKVSFTISAGSTQFVSGDNFSFSTRYVATPVSGSVGNGVMSSLETRVLAVPEVWTVTMTSLTAFSVVGSVSGAQAAGVVGSAYDNGKIAFTLNQGSTAFAVADAFTITATSVTLSTPLGNTNAARRVNIVRALQASINSNVDVRSELYEFNLTLCPGYHEVVDELNALCTDVLGEAMVIADTPCNLNADQVAQWALTTARVSNTSVAYYYPWCLMSNIDGRDVLGAPSGTALRTIAVSDAQSYVWMAPAGLQRGVVTGVSKVGYVTGTLGTASTFVELNLNVGQRDNLYEYDKNLNPITFFPGRGIVVWGQKTSAPAASALDRINVVRLVAFLRRTLRKGAMPFVFEPNDQITRDNLKAAADGKLADILAKRGLYDFATQCDANNNTAARIDANELWLDCAIKCVKSSEFIYIPIKIVSTGANI